MSNAGNHSAMSSRPKMVTSAAFESVFSQLDHSNNQRVELLRLCLTYTDNSFLFLSSGEHRFGLFPLPNVHTELLAKKKKERNLFAVDVWLAAHLNIYITHMRETASDQTQLSIVTFEMYWNSNVWVTAAIRKTLWLDFTLLYNERVRRRNPLWLRVSD